LCKALCLFTNSLAALVLTSGFIYGVREALILPIPRTKKGGIISSATTATARGTTPVATTKTNKATYADGAIHYIYGDWIYVTVK
jgi:alkylation response protein AidB-like acyl-CoA dehydrogenase